MKSLDYLLVGGGLAAMKAATRIRDLDPKGSMLLVGEEPHAPYDRPPLSKELLRGEVRPKDIVCERRWFYLRRRIKMRTGARVVEFRMDANPEAARPHVARLSDGKQVAFRKALLATGGSPRRLEGVPGSKLAGVYVLRTVDHAQRIAARARQGAHAVVVGAGFIGLELAASLRQLGCEVTVLEQQPRVWAGFAPPEVSDYIERYLSEKGIGFRKEASLAAFHGTGEVSSVRTSGGEDLSCDFVCVCTGIEPRTELARSAGVDVDDGVVTDAQLRSSHADLYAAGDIAAVPDPYFNRRRRVEHYGQAEYTGLLAGENMTGGDRSYDLLSYLWSDMFDLHFEFAGDEHDYDEMVIRGDIEQNRALLLFLKEQRLSAYLGINAAEADFGPLQMVIKRGVDLSGARDQLTDPEFPLPKLLQ